MVTVHTTPHSDLLLLLPNTNADLVSTYPQYPMMPTLKMLRYLIGGIPFVSSDFPAALRRPQAGFVFRKNKLNFISFKQ